MKQSDIFAESEGDAWLERNRTKLGERDPVSELIERAGIKPTSVLEIGCANGWRLAHLRKKYGCEVHGVEPSMQGCIEAATGRVSVWRCTAESLPAGNEAYDLVIYGFCLYCTDPADWFKIVAEGDRVLRPDGHIVIHDFCIRPDDEAHVRQYEHRDDISSYHVDFPHFWLANPLYSHVSWSKAGDEELVEIIHKAHALPVRP